MTGLRSFSTASLGWRGLRRSLWRWFAASVAVCAGVGTLPALAAATPGVTEYSAGISAGSQPRGITAGHDGNLWFTESSGNRMGRITLTGVVTEFSAGITPDSYPHEITVGPDGNLWFTESVGNRVGRITPEGVVTEFSAGISPGSYPNGITAGPDGNLWFTESLGDRVGRITPEGVVTEFSVSPRSYPTGITAGPDGNLWFTEFANGVGRITPDGVVTEFSAGITVGSDPLDIAAGPDGNLWFTESRGDRVGRITPTGVVTEFSAGITPGSYPSGIAAGSDGNLWFTERRGDRVGRITPSGVVTEFSAGITPGSGPAGIAAGSDGNLWFTEPSAARVARIADLPPLAVTGGASEISQSGATVAGRVHPNSQPTKVSFEYGPTVAYGLSTVLQSAGADSAPVETYATLDGLAAGTRYHYRLVASNASGTSYGADATLITAAAASPSPTSPAPLVTPVAGLLTAKLALARATINRRDRVLDVLAPVTSLASGRVRVELHAAGRRYRFTAPVDSQDGRIGFRKRIPRAQADLGTGIVTIAYPGDEDTRPQEVRLRAASHKANLELQRPVIEDGRLKAQGAVSDRARGLVRLQLQYVVDGQTETLKLRGRIDDGRWKIDEALSEVVRDAIGRRTGTVHSYTLFTGYYPRRVRGEMRSYQVLPAR